MAGRSRWRTTEGRWCSKFLGELVCECRPEMPVFERLHRELSPQGFAVIGVNAREESEAVRRYASELGLTFPLMLDPDGKIKALYGVVGHSRRPSSSAGTERAVAFGVGPREWASPPARALIQALLAEPCRATPGRTMMRRRLCLLALGIVLAIPG